MNEINRRKFFKKTGALSASIILSPGIALMGNDASQIEKWQAMMKDPVYDMLKGEPDLDKILGLFPRPQGEPAFDPMEIQENMKKLKTVPVVNTGHPFLDLSIKVGLAHIDATFEGNHPKYGVRFYGKTWHDGFPPTIIAAVDALSAWGMNERATELFHYWINNFVYADGTINYYGPSIAEYGQLLHTATILYERAGKGRWWSDCFPQINLLAEYLLQLHAEALKDDGLISGVPEADTRREAGKYFHNNAWVVKGLKQWIKLCKIANATPTSSLNTILKSSDQLKNDTLLAIKETWPSNGDAWWLPALFGSTTQPRNLTDGNEVCYTNYRYWLELLSSEILPKDMANRLVNARLNGGGQFCGMTRFSDHLDDWPLADYLYALWSLGRKNDFLLSLYGHIAYHQCEGHLTAYEQINFPGDPKGSKRADYCLPCQLVATRAGRLMNKS